MRIVAGAVALVLVISGYTLWKGFRSPDMAEDGNSEERLREIAAVTLSPEEILEKQRRGEPVVFIDIRSPEAFAASRIPGSRQIPASALASFAPSANALHIIVTSALESAANDGVRNLLSGADFSYAFIEGGFENWTAQGGSVLSSGDPNSFVDQSKVTYLPVEAAKPLIEGNAPDLYILDVRPAAAFGEKHIRGARNIPFEELESRVGEIPAATRVLVYGENELSSFRAGVRLFDLNVYGVETLPGNNLLTPESGLPLEP